MGAVARTPARQTLAEHLRRRELRRREAQVVAGALTKSTRVLRRRQLEGAIATMPVRSQLLVNRSILAAALDVLYTSPPGYRTIIKQVELVVGPGNGASISFQINHGTILSTVLVQATAPNPAGRTGFTGLFLVLDPGDSFEARSGVGASAAVHASGAQLLLP